MTMLKKTVVVVEICNCRADDHQTGSMRPDQTREEEFDRRRPGSRMRGWREEREVVDEVSCSGDSSTIDDWAKREILETEKARNACPH